MKINPKNIAVCSVAISSMLLSSTLFAENILPSQKPIVEHPSEMHTDRIIIRMRADSDDLNNPALRSRKLEGLSQQAGFEIGYNRSMSGRSHVLSMSERLPLHVMQGILARLRQNPDVEYAEPDAILQSMRVPNDTFYNDYQWHYHESAVEQGAVNLPAAWDITTGNSNVVVSVIDTGILPHADLGGRIVPGYDFISTAFVGNDGDGRDSNPADSGDWSAYGECYSGSPASGSSWHGTHVAGTIGAASDNGYGVAGVNWNSMIQPVRVLGKCGGYTSDIADAIRWSSGISVGGVPNNGTPAQVINMSLGGAYTCSPGGAMQLAINDAAINGAVIVVAAGNSNMDAANFTPAGCANVITVAANNRYASKAYYSNYGNTVEIAAPGGESPLLPDGILSTLDAGSTSALGDDAFAFYQGTSMAAPHVAGVVSLMASAYYEQTGKLPSPDILKQELLSSARAFPAGSSCSTATCGAGIVDAASAVSAMIVATPEPVPNNAPVVTVGADFSVEAGQSVTLTGNATDDGNIVAYRWIQVSGPMVSLSGADTLSVSFVAGAEDAVLSFRLEAEDDLGLTASAGINVTVIAPVLAPVNVEPVSNDLALVTDKNTPVSSRLVATDADGDVLFYTVVVQPTNGSVVYDNNTGNFTYTPKRRFIGSDSFSYIASDAVSSSMPASVSITINGSTKGGGKKTGDSGTKKGGPKK